MNTQSTPSFKGPNPGILAIVFTLLFNTGLSYVISFSGGPHFPNPYDNPDAISQYFITQPGAVVLCAFFQFASAIPLGLYTATMVGRMRFLSNNNAASFISLFGGFFVVFNLALSAMILWTLAYPGVASDAGVVRALYYLSFATGGVGYSVPLGLLIAGVSVASGFMKWLPKWLVVYGLILAVVGEFSILDLISPKFVALIPLTRFPGFIWLIFVGFKFPKKIHQTQMGQI
jgi:hypothetical protein